MPAEINTENLSLLISRAGRHRRLVEIAAPDMIIRREANLVLKAAYQIAGMDPDLIGPIDGDPFINLI